LHLFSIIYIKKSPKITPFFLLNFLKFNNKFFKASASADIFEKESASAELFGERECWF